ncbi:hypothetical protein NE865_16467 [Phthorimaea operculella]|nr:hypothetical protein NE865_16467 [Phthorimaea operculella]
MGMLRDFSDCHDDHGLKPPDGLLKDHLFTWVAFVQYIHVTTSLPHHSKAPRVVLVHKQFGLGTATDLLHLPKNYKLGNVVFGDYERDEEDCGLTLSQIKIGLKCPRAYIEMPVSDIIPHPEFTRFGVGNSIALIKFLRPMKSHYMIPVCLPTPFERDRLRRKKVVFLVDYRLGSEGVTHVLCTSGCGVRSGAPILAHAADGPFELIGINAGGAPCRSRANRRRLNPQPPIYIDIYPYTQWISNVVTAHIMPRPYPEHFQLTDFGGYQVHPEKNSYLRARAGPPTKSKREGWRSRTFVSGRSCFDRFSKQKKMAFFYDEKFEVNADPPGKLNIFMKIFATWDVTIQCVKMTLPNRLSEPTIKGVRESNVSIEFEWTVVALLVVPKNLGKRNIGRVAGRWTDDLGG